MAESGREILEQPKTPVDTRLRIIKDRQNEERQRKLEEIKAQAFAAQRYKEQKEDERRRRLEELRIRDEAKRRQVEERKRAITDAEKNRLEFIIKRNTERDQRMESKRRNERSNPVFAFGSSTPRMLEPMDVNVSFWGHRKATSIQNISASTSSAASSLTRRQSERDLDIGNKKRATSATGLERSCENNVPAVPAGCASGYLGRRRTDLVPTIPSRDSSFTSSRKSLNHSPGRAYSMTRLDQLAKPRRRADLPSLDESQSSHSRPLSSSRVFSITRSMSHLAVGKSRPSPTTKLDKENSRSMHHLVGDGVSLAPRTTRTTQLREQKLHASSNNIEASSRPSSSLSQQSTNSVTSSASVRHRVSATPRKPRPISIAVTGITHDILKSDKRNETKPPLPKTRKSISKTTETGTPKSKVKSPVETKNKEITNGVQIIVKATDETQKKPPDASTTIQKEIKTEVIPTKNIAEVPKSEQESKSEVVPEAKEGDITLVKDETRIEDQKIVEIKGETLKTEIKEAKIAPMESKVEASKDVTVEISQEIKVEVTEGAKTEYIKEQQQIKQDVEGSTEKTLPEIVTKPANDTVEIPEKPAETNLNESVVATKLSVETNIENKENTANNEMTASMIKRISTEEEAKAAIAEKRRLIREEAERQAEMERLRIEAEAKAELERQQREEEQVRQLIEMQRQAEQERLKEAIRETQKREEEERLKREEEQKLKVLKEEAEKKAREDAERQKAELQERLKNEEKEREARRKRVEAIMLRTRGKNNANLASQPSTDDKNENKAEEEDKSIEENKLNGTKIIEQQENGTTKNGKDAEIVDNIIQSDMVKNANTLDTINSTDTINSNNSWRDSQQFDSLI